MRILKTLPLLCALAYLLGGCGYNQIDTVNRLMNTKWYFLDYDNDQTIQTAYPQPRTKAEYLQQNNCLSGEITFSEPNSSTTFGALQISDYCGRPTSQPVISAAFSRQQIEFFLNNRSSSEGLEWGIHDNNQSMSIYRRWNGTDYVATFRVFFSESGNEMIWLFQGQYSRRITWSKNFQPVP